MAILHQAWHKVGALGEDLLQEATNRILLQTIVPTKPKEPIENESLL